MPDRPLAQADISNEMFISLASAAMLRASRKVAAENKRLGLPLIVTKSKAPASKRGSKTQGR